MPRLPGTLVTTTSLQLTTRNWDAPVAYNPAMSCLTVYDAAALTFIMAMYWLEHRGSVFILTYEKLSAKNPTTSPRLTSE